ncbi:hypothetical protein CROQUDRAFT_98765 [Cronartium quercuum f. sp. fusiforme G11]|uniref:Uncharacterized protein n=1 Tax=Cronartium quercuum f. sp. fusiforme G11 TaxID=708437 RepID=A0A9P6NBX4_9BASI|nr:hypothetical protein CROQUDRAFT_98765 [Cronartium quercuum f. sp. fusiforme G11]
MPPPAPLDPRQTRTPSADNLMDMMDSIDASDASNTHTKRQNWADEVVEAEATRSHPVEDDLMEAWLEATKHTNSDRNVVLVPTVIKLVTALLRKVTIALKDAHQAHQRVDHLEVKLAELANKPHPLPPRPTTWATVTRQTRPNLPLGMRTDANPAPLIPPPPKTINEFKASALVI